MRNNNIEPLQKARDYAFFLLKFRPRSEKEIYEHLKRKRFEERIIKQTISFLKDKNFINDTDFAKAWIESRLKKPLGLYRIKNELKIKGINSEIIDTQLQEIKSSYCEEEIVTKLTQERMTKLKEINPQKVKSRLYAYLLRRGFSADIVIDVIKKLCNQTYSEINF